MATMIHGVAYSKAWFFITTVHCLEYYHQLYINMCTDFVAAHMQGVRCYAAAAEAVCLVKNNTLESGAIGFYCDKVLLLEERVSSKRYGSAYSIKKLLFVDSDLAVALVAQAPIRVYGLAGRYAHSLFAAASKKKELDTVDSELKIVKDMLASNQAFNDFCHDASLQRSEKSVGVKAIMKKGGFSPLTTDFMGAYQP
jgi:F-type H+-transporting ATPase subunit O